MRRSSVAGCPFYGFSGDRKHGQLMFPSVIVGVLCRFHRVFIVVTNRQLDLPVDLENICRSCYAQLNVLAGLQN